MRILVIGSLYCNFFFYSVIAHSVVRGKRQEICIGKSFRCSDGQCIDIRAVCNGSVDCGDGSDETQDACSKYTLKCPQYDFTCNYGACINSNKRCNGNKDCADNSDEEHCELRHPTKNNVDCGDGKFLCRNGNCIDYILTCDGYDDCLEEAFLPPEKNTNVSSDEEISLCINRRCPKFTFQCAYGACIDKEKKCDSNPDCYDKSDEDEELCRQSIDIRFSKDGKCEVFSSPNAEVKCSLLGHPVRCDVPAAKSTIMGIRCKNGGFHKNDLFSFYSESICLENGNWSPTPHDDCTICGKRYDIGNYIPLITHAETTKYLEYPWHTGLYAYDPLRNVTSYLCGGSIIHPWAILTAAHCLYNETISAVSTQSYWVAVGKYNSSWTSFSPLEQRLKVQKIHINKYYIGVRGRYSNDIAILELEKEIQFNGVVTAVCIDWENHFHPEKQKPYALGTVVGWGVTEDNTDKESELPRYAKLRFYDFENCIEEIKDDLAQFITPDKICAGLGNDTIVQKGDSGGGLTFAIPDSNKKEMNYVYGIVSIKDRTDNKLAAFTKVTTYLEWIKLTLHSIIDGVKRYKH